MLPSLFSSEENPSAWSVPRAALYGAGIGLVAALIKLFSPLSAADSTLPPVLEIGLAVLGFALLFGGAAALRNRLARDLQDPG